MKIVRRIIRHLTEIGVWRSVRTLVLLRQNRRSLQKNGFTATVEAMNLGDVFGHPTTSSTKDDIDEAAKTVRAAHAIGRRINATCLPQSLTACAMLRRDGVESRIRVGVARPSPDEPVSAHAWIEIGGTCIGENPLGTYHPFDGEQMNQAIRALTKERP